MNIPNLITVLRVLLIPIFILLFYLPYEWSYAASSSVFAFAAATDWLDGYLARLPAELHHPGAAVLPGVPTLLETAAARPDITQALLTGNVRRAARVKLAHHGLWEFFPFGAFADDSELRNDLGPHALRRAREHPGVTFPADRVWIIGDTPHDIACGRAIGANTLAVATGGHSVAALSAHQPTAILSDLGDTDTFWRLINGPA